MGKEKNIKKKKTKKNKRGFTLIELLAVIIILGVILLIAVPAVSRYIESSRISTYVTSVKSVVNAITTSVNNLEYPVPGNSEAIIIPFSEAEVEKDSAKTKSPFAPYEDGKSYVIVTFRNGSYQYYVVALDEKGYSIPLIEITELDEESITTDVDTIANNVHSMNDIIDNKSKVFDTYPFAMKYKSQSNKFIKVSVGEAIYNAGSVVQLKDGSKWYVLPTEINGNTVRSDTLEDKTINLISYNNMETSELLQGRQSDSKTEPTIIFHPNKELTTYEDAQAYSTSQSIINKTKTNLMNGGVNLFGTTVDLPKTSDFCGYSYSSTDLQCKSIVTNLGNVGEGNYWTKDLIIKGSGTLVVVINNKTISTASPNAGSLSSGYGIRVVIRDILKSNVDKAATKKLN